MVVQSGLIEQTPFWKDLYINGCKDLQYFFLRAKKFIPMDVKHHAMKEFHQECKEEKSNPRRLDKRLKESENPKGSRRKISNSNHVALN